MKAFVSNQLTVAIIKQLPAHMWTPCRQYIEKWVKEHENCTVDEGYEALNKFIYETYAKEQGD